MHSRCESGTCNKYIKSLKVCVSVFARLYHQILAWLLSTILLAVIKTPKDATIDVLSSHMFLLRACVPVICVPNQTRKMPRRLWQTRSSLRKKNPFQIYVYLSHHKTCRKGQELVSRRIRNARSGNLSPAATTTLLQLPWRKR